MVATAPMMNRFTHSTIGNSENRKPEYSVLYPDTNSDSASGRSNGVRLPSASAEMNQMKKATNVNGLRNRNQPHGAAPCASTIFCVESEPVSVAIVTSATEAGSS